MTHLTVLLNRIAQRETEPGALEGAAAALLAGIVGLVALGSLL